jgi:hypothetical protein
MKVLKTGALCVLLNVIALTVAAQNHPNNPPVTEPDYNKPKLFADLPQRFKFDVKATEALLDRSVGEKVNVHMTGNLQFHGTIVSKSDPSNKDIKSVVIKSINRQGATLTFTRIQNEDGSFDYKSRIMSFKHSDALELTWEDGQYVLHKKHLYDLYNE